MDGVSVCVWLSVVIHCVIQIVRKIYLKDVFMHAHREGRIGKNRQFGLKQKLKWSALDEGNIYIYL